VKVEIVGGGPGGLYFSILLKKQLPDAVVRVWERNAPDDTFGWGVVFSNETLGNIEAADPETYDAITRRFAHWDDIDVFFRGRRVRSGGHGFCGLARRRMLELLQSRARGLGVDLRFQTELDDDRIAALRQEADLLVAADGVNSAARRIWAGSFQPSLDVRPNRYVWLGTHQTFDAFTFAFRENEAGRFWIHAYQFDPETSTFIVETDEASFERSGLDEDDEDATRRYCQELFRGELGGHELLTNRSRWIRFVTVRNASWRHDNVVLLGDAAHTAHFSIGSGTKLAMEDAIALAQAFEVAGAGDVPGALAHYEAARRPVVESTQRAAQSSLEWFERMHLHWDEPPERFAFSLLTRSMRVTHGNLRVRDPAYVDGLDRWHARSTGSAPPTTGDVSAPPVPPMFTSLRLAELTLANRVVVSPMCMYSAEDGLPNDWHLVHLGSRAVGGAGLVMTEMTDVSRDGRISPGCTGLWNDAQTAAWSRIVDFVHAHGPAKIGVQLGHAGRKGSTQRLWEQPDHPLPDGNWPVLGPSPIPWSEVCQTPREMTRHDMVAVRDDFVAASRRAVTAGFDLLEIHFAHGYLLSSFLTPVSNQRGDAYGGSLENRARFPLEVLDACREVWPRDRPLSVRISATDWVPGGFDPDQAVALSGMLREHGVDLVDVSAGQTTPAARPVYGRAFQTPFAERIRHEAGIPTIAVGNISTYDDVNTIVLAGRADLVALARAHLADPYWTLHAAREQGYQGVPWPPQYRSASTLRRLVV
jgi:anthraniloyl-CoA monooxygenase